MELADDICFCLSDIADSFEKGVTNSREFKEDFGAICRNNDFDPALIIPDVPIANFSHQVAIPVARLLIKEAVSEFADNLDHYIEGDAPELAEVLPSGPVLRSLKQFSRRFIYTNAEVQRIEIAGAKVVEGLLEHFGRLLKLDRADFVYFIEKGEVPKARGLDTEWRIFNQVSNRMLQVYKRQSRGCSDTDERICRSRLIVDYISGMTDNSALETYRNFMGIKL
jgi:dGTPase